MLEGVTRGAGGFWEWAVVWAGSGEVIDCAVFRALQLDRRLLIWAFGLGLQGKRLLKCLAGVRLGFAAT